MGKMMALGEVSSMNVAQKPLRKSSLLTFSTSFERREKIRFGKKVHSGAKRSNNRVARARACGNGSAEMGCVCKTEFQKPC